MKKRLKIMKIVSIPIVVLVAILMVSCGGEGDGGKDSDGDVTIPSIFTNFDLPHVFTIVVDASALCVRIVVVSR